VTISTFNGGIVNSGTINAAQYGIQVGGLVGLTGTVAIDQFSGGISNGGMISVAGSGGGIVVGGAATRANLLAIATFSGGISNSGTITASAANGVLIGGIARSGSVIAISTFAGGITNSGAIAAQRNGILIGGSTQVGGASLTIATFGGGIANSGTISAGSAGIFIGATGAGSVTVSTFAGGITNVGTIIGHTGIALGAGVATFSGAIVNSGTIAGAGGTAIDVAAAANAITIDQTGGLISGAIRLSANADVLNISGGAIDGNIVGAGTQNTINFNLGAGTFVYGPGFGFSGINQVNIQSGIVVLDGVNSATNLAVNGGTLEIGDAANPGATLTIANPVDVFGTLAGHGTLVGSAVIESGGTLTPGGSIGTLTISGALTFNAGSFYAIQVSDVAASKTLVTGAPGTANIIGGTVMVMPQFSTLGAHGSVTYTILTAAGGRTGTFAALTVMPASNSTFTGGYSLSYDPNDVFLNVGSGLVLLASPSGANVNQQDVLNGINAAILGGSPVPGQFQNLLGLSHPAFLNALTQLDGEDATGAERGAFRLMNGFLGLMLDPFVNGRGGGAGGLPLGFASDREASLPPDVALAYARVLKAPPKSSTLPTTFEQRWTAWGAAFGGSGTADGDAAIGSSNVTTSTYGYAAGMDYRYSPDTVFGFALAGGGTNWNLAQALGTGRSDAFLAGVHGVKRWGPAYLAGGVAFANNWFATNRTALGDQLTASFQGQSYGARLEGGYRFRLALDHAALGVTPYAAVELQNFRTPSYSATDLTGGAFGLSYDAQNSNHTRSELGTRLDDLTTIANMPLLLRLKVAWAHDWVSNPALNAAFEALPGSSFTVFGAPMPHDSALTSAGVQLFVTPNWSVLAKFDGELANGSQSYAGTGAVRYSW
jgi:uncharacterized protein with beta-barrel porin domain